MSNILQKYIISAINSNIDPSIIACLMDCDKAISISSKTYEYDIDGIIYKIYDNNVCKVIIASDDSYHLFFLKKNGFTVRFGKTFDDDPSWCPVGPEILDIEISINGCPKINGASCKFCYKSNTDRTPTNMSLKTFQDIITKMPRSLYEVAIGITGVQTNPDFVSMLKWLREDTDIIPNYTLSGADLNDEILEATVKYCGRIAVSIYNTDKNLAYSTIKKFYDRTGEKFCNAHVVMSEDNKDFIKEIIDDYANGRIVGLRNLVFLRIKPVGRASFLDTTLTRATVKEIIELCNKNNVPFGFDSCSAPGVQSILEELGMANAKNYCEGCESSRLSSYINTFGQYCHCSFCEHIHGVRRFNVLDENLSWYQLWNVECEKFRNATRCSNSCPMLNIDFS